MTWWDIIYTFCDYIEERDLKMRTDQRRAVRFILFS